MASDATLRAVPRGTRRRVPLAFLLIVPVAMGSCAPRTLNATQLERRLGRELSADLGVPGIVAECPVGVEVERGATFRCTARAPGESDVLRVDVTQVDDDGHVTWEIAGTAE
jgi:hypothetical protein